MKRTLVYLTTATSVILIILLSSFVHVGKTPVGQSSVGQNAVTFTIGNNAYATGIADYVCDGIADDAQIQMALNELPNLGGKLVILGGDYHFVNTVSRNIDNVIIEGAGDATYIACNDLTPVFSAYGCDGWTFANFRTDIGWIAAGTDTNFINMNRDGLKITVINGISMVGDDIELPGTINDVDISDLQSGSKWYSDFGYPPEGIGIDGDCYLNALNSFIYQKDNGVWDFVSSIKGENGEQGIQGLQGQKGDTGSQGIQGLQGIQGIKGDTGDVGSQGIQGIKGDTGSQGIQGEIGDTGSQGIPGIKGDIGDQGIQGLQGGKGEKGDMGSQGIQGIQGEIGPNQVTNFTATNITGLIKGNGAVVSASSASVSILEATTESFTTAIKSSYDSAVANSHTHSNKITLDLITEAFTTSLKNTYDSLVTNSHTHSNKTVLDNTQEAFTSALKSSYDSAVSASHSHSNKSILDTVTEAFTTSLKNSYDSATSLAHSNTNDPTADQKSALAGTSGTPSSTNKYVTNSDSRNTDARTPTAHNQDASTITTGTLDGNVLPSMSATKKGGVPATGTPSGSYLKDDGTWATPASGTGLGMSINVQALSSSPTDAQTVYFGTLPKAPITTANISKIYIRKAGTIKIAEIYCYSGTAGTSESWSLYIRKNNTTDYLIATLAVAASERVFSNTALSISVIAGDYVEIKGIQPTWATNPATTIYGGYIYIE
jgi:hypothetical protein